MIIQLKTKTDINGNTYYLRWDDKEKTFSDFRGFSDMELKGTKKELNHFRLLLLKYGYIKKDF